MFDNESLQVCFGVLTAALQFREQSESKIKRNTLLIIMAAFSALLLRRSVLTRSLQTRLRLGLHNSMRSNCRVLVHCIFSPPNADAQMHFALSIPRNRHMAVRQRQTENLEEPLRVLREGI